MEKEELIKKVLEISGFKELNPVQKQAVKMGLLRRKNLVVAAPTASGKTLIGELAMLNTFYQGLGKTIYLVPLVALANEKFADFKKKYEKLGIKVAMSVGDMDSSDPWLKNYDLIVCSVDYDEPFILEEEGKVKNVFIGEFIDELLERHKDKVYHPLPFFDVLDIARLNLKTATFNPRTYKLNFRKISKVVRHKINEPLYKITLETGREVKVTGSHSIFVLDGLEVKSKEATKLRVGDYVVIPRRIPSKSNCNEKINLLKELINLGHTKGIYVGNLPSSLIKEVLEKKNYPRYLKANWKKRRHLPLRVIVNAGILEKVPPNSIFSYKGCRTRLKIFVKVSAELARLIGYYIAEGSIDSKRHKISFVFNSTEKRYADDLADCTYNLFKFKPTFEFKKNIIVVNVSNKIVCTFFEKILKVEKKAENKSIPEIVFSFFQHLQLEFLKASIRGDGVASLRRPSYITVSRKLASDMLYLLLGLNVIGSVHHSKQRHRKTLIEGREIFPNPAWTVYVSSTNIKSALIDARDCEFPRSRSQPRVAMIPSEQIKDIFKKLWRIRSVYPFTHLGRRLSKLRFERWINSREKKEKIRILRSLTKQEMTPGQLAEVLGMKWHTLNDHLNSLIRRGLIAKEGSFAHHTYKLTDEGKEFLTKLEKLIKLFNGDLAFAKVKKIELVKSVNGYVYDVSIPGYENFISGIGGVICHNTNEKIDSLIRHGAEWISELALVVVDEIHMLTDASRGPTLEITLTRLRKIVPNVQYLALSATIKNVEELAKWLKAEVVSSNWRPVKLYQGTCYPSKIVFNEKSGYELSPELPIEAAIAENTLNLKKQALFFVATRRSAESLAEKISRLIEQKLTKAEKLELRKLAGEVESVLEIPTKQCRRVAKCLRGGVAFHHAGLLYKQRYLIEENFRKGLIKIIVATPTLAFGLNLPAFRVIMRDLKRYYPGVGTVFVPILEVQQMLGRSGRPAFDPFGEGIILARDEKEAEELTEHYIYGEPEDITSKLAVEPVLRMHTLSLIASEFCKSEKALLEFFSKTFFAFHYGGISLVEEKILDILDLLSEWKFIFRKKDKLLATRIGKRVSELYIDPLTAHNFIEALKQTTKKEAYPFSFLQIISNTIEMRPLLSVKTGEFSEIEKILVEREKSILQDIPEEWDLDFDEFFKSIKTALMFELWINEATEEQILTSFRVAPGELRGRLEVADWLVYSLQELALLLGYKEVLKEIRKLRIRMKYGIKEELIPLVRLKDVGRRRARILWGANLRSLNDLRKIPYESLSRIIGHQVAKSIKDQLEGKEERKKTEKQVTLKKY